MLSLQPQPGQLIVLVGGSDLQRVMLSTIADLALTGPVQVVDGGNRFDAFYVARQLRRRTVEVEAALHRIHIARPFTCYQVVALFEQTKTLVTPHIIFDLLNTFYDESVTLAESGRLLRLVLQHLERLRGTVPIVITVRPPPADLSPRRRLLHLVVDLADQVIVQERPQPPEPPRLL